MTASQGKRKGRALPGRGTRGFRGRDWQAWESRLEAWGTKGSL